MDLGWPHRRCILCLREPSADVPFSRAHLIPEAVGGFAWAWTKCKDCNDRAGHQIEAPLVKDDSIVFAVSALARELPELAREFAERQTLIAKTPSGLIRARQRGDDVEILTTRNDDGSLTQSRERAWETLETRLRREGKSADELAAAKQLFDEAVEGVPVQIGDNHVVHGKVEQFGPAFDGAPVSDAFPALVAFHFLALAMGPNVYDERLNALRDAVRAGEPQSDWYSTEGLIDRGGYRTEHLVGLSQTSPYVVVRVQLFGWSVWRVHFPRIASTSEPHGILFDLKEQRLVLAAPDRPTSFAVPPDSR